jgi:uncharacterized membrane protein
MLKRLIISQIFKTILSSMKGGKKWLVILVGVLVLIAQASGLELGASFDAFAADVLNIFTSTINQ